MILLKYLFNKIRSLYNFVNHLMIQNNLNKILKKLKNLYKILKIF